MNVTTIGIDLAKNTFSLHGVDSRGKMVFRKTLSRGKLLPFLAQQPPSLIGMEACSGAHHWGRQLQALGHRTGSGSWHPALSPLTARVARTTARCGSDL